MKRSVEAGAFEKQQGSAEKLSDIVKGALLLRHWVGSSHFL